MPTPDRPEHAELPPVPAGRIPLEDVDDEPDREELLARFLARRAAAPPLTSEDEALIAELLAGADERLARWGIFPTSLVGRQPLSCHWSVPPTRPTFTNEPTYGQEQAVEIRFVDVDHG